MRVLIGLLLALLSFPAAAGVGETLALIEKGDLAGARHLADGVPDAGGLQRIAEAFYGVGSAEAVEDALRLFDRALALRESRATEEPEPLADLLHDLSSVHYNAGSYAMTLGDFAQLGELLQSLLDRSAQET